MKPRVAIGRLALAKTSEKLPLTQQSSPSRNEDGFIVDAKERAEHWLNLWANFWTAKRGWQ